MNIEIRAMILFFTLKGFNRKPILVELPFGKDSAWLREDEKIPLEPRKRSTWESAESLYFGISMKNLVC
jgi:hypothetical protein